MVFQQKWKLTKVNNKKSSRSKFAKKAIFNLNI